MGKLTTAFGQTTHGTVKELKHTQMARNTKDDSLTGLRKGTEFYPGRMGHTTKAVSAEASSPGMGRTFGLMEDATQETGRKERCTEPGQ
jgi:hypothetical protein